MQMKSLLAAAGALALSSTPVLAEAASPAADRAAAPVEAQNDLFGGSTLLTIIAIVAIGVGLFLILDDDNSDSP